MKYAFQILDDVSVRATWAIPGALMADFTAAEAARAERTPANLIAGLEGAAVTLAERTYLDLFDSYTAGRIGDEFDFSGHYDDILLNFHNRIVSTLRFVPSVPEDWTPACGMAIREAFTQRVRQLGMSSIGGWA